MKALALGLILMATPAIAATPKTVSLPTTLPDMLSYLVKNGTSSLIADLQTIDSVAGVVDPNNTNLAPYNVYNYPAHACAVATIPWLMTFPSPSTIPQPTGAGGIITTLVMAQIKLDVTQEFVASITAKGIPMNVQFNCAALWRSLATEPAKVAANAQTDLLNFLKIVTQH